MESPFLYDRAVFTQNYLIIPFQFAQAGGYPIYSYGMLSASGHRSAFHQAINPARLYSGSLSGVVEIAREHLTQTLVVARSDDPSLLDKPDGPRRFQQKLAEAQLAQTRHGAAKSIGWGDRHSPSFYHRYTYRGHLLILSELRGRYLYHHYLPYELRNVARPQLFGSASECLTWVKLKIDQQSPEVLQG